MSRPLENPLTFRSLYDSPLVSVRDYCCRISGGGPGDEEQSDTNQIVLMRHGAFSKHFGRRSVTADVNQALFFSKGSTYRVSHPADCGDRGVVFTISMICSGSEETCSTCRRLGSANRDTVFIKNE